jgi:hypothetical protein
MPKNYEFLLPLLLKYNIVEKDRGSLKFFFKGKEHKKGIFQRSVLSLIIVN